MILLLIPVALLAVVVGLQFGWRWVLAPLLGAAIYVWATSTLRSMARGSADPGAPEPIPVDAPERTLYWCEECGTELLLLVRGSGVVPRHCGTRMHERTELV